MKPKAWQLTDQSALDPYAGIGEKERIELERRVEAASKADGQVWAEKYKSEMMDAIAFFEAMVLESNGWDFIPAPSKETEHIQLFVRSSPDGSYIVKAVGELEGRPSRIAYLNRDNTWATRKEWDATDLIDISEVGKFDCDELGYVYVVESKIRAPRPLWDRYSLGIQWVDFDKETGQHKIVFCTSTHFFAQCPSDMVSITASTGVWVAPVPGEKKRSQVIMVAKVHPGGIIPNWVVNLFYEKLRTRMLTYEKVVKRWNSIYKGKNPVRKRTPAEERAKEMEECNE